MAIFSMGESYFIIERDFDEIDHLWIIVSDPNIDHQRLVLVPMSTLEEYKECICRIDEGEHPRAQHDSVIEYRFAKVRSSEWLQDKVNEHKARKREDFGQNLLDRIHGKAEDSRFISLDCLHVLSDQNLLP